jgi:hypothetical protein
VRVKSTRTPFSSTSVAFGAAMPIAFAGSVEAVSARPSIRSVEPAYVTATSFTTTGEVSRTFPARLTVDPSYMTNDWTAPSWTYSIFPLKLYVPNERVAFAAHDL